MPKPFTKLRCKLNDLKNYSKRYSYKDDDKVMFLVEEIRKRGFIQKDELFLVAKWKSPRRAKNVHSNPEEYVKEPG
jgi:hypothetical protein